MGQRIVVRPPLDKVVTSKPSQCKGPDAGKVWDMNGQCSKFIRKNWGTR